MAALGGLSALAWPQALAATQAARQTSGEF